MSLLAEALRRAEDDRPAPTSRTREMLGPPLELEPLIHQTPPTRTPTEGEGSPHAIRAEPAGRQPPLRPYPRRILLAGLAGATALVALAIGIGFEMRPLAQAEPSSAGTPASTAALAPQAGPDHPPPAPSDMTAGPNQPTAALHKPATPLRKAHLTPHESRPTPAKANTAPAIRLKSSAATPDDVISNAHSAFLAHDLPHAEALYREALQATPTSTDALRGLGATLARQQRWAEAGRTYATARNLTPEDPDFAYNMAVALDQGGQPRAAATHYRLALALAARHPARFDQAEGSARLQALISLEPSP